MTFYSDILSEICYILRGGIAYYEFGKGNGNFRIQENYRGIEGGNDFDFLHFESQEGTFPDACIATNFSLNENGDIM